MRWRRCIDTALASPEDIHHLDEAPVVDGRHYRVEARSLVVLGLTFRERHHDFDT